MGVKSKEGQEPVVGGRCGGGDEKLFKEASTVKGGKKSEGEKGIWGQEKKKGKNELALLALTPPHIVPTKCRREGKEVVGGKVGEEKRVKETPSSCNVKKKWKEKNWRKKSKKGTQEKNRSRDAKKGSVDFSNSVEAKVALLLESRPGGGAGKRGHHSRREKGWWGQKLWERTRK